MASVKQALKTLAGEGLVELVPTRGAVVRSFSLKDIADSMEVLKALEQLAGRRACAVASDEGIAQVLFFKGDEPPEISYKDKAGKYQGQTGVTLPKL